MKNAINKTLFYILSSPFCLTVLFFTLTLLFFTPIYDENDDVSILRMASGYYSGSPSPLLVYINPLYGLLLVKLYRFFPDIAWYGILFLAILFIGLYFTLRFIFSITQGLLLRFTEIVYIMPFYFYATVFVQYTTVASVAAYTGFIIVCQGVLNPKNLSVRLILVGTFLIFLAGLIRDNVLFYVTLLSIPLLIFSFFDSRSVVNKRILAGSLIIIFILFLLSKLYSGIVYSKSEDWRSHMTWISNLQAYHYGYYITEYTKNKDLYDDIGWSKNDYLMFLHWFYTDESRFSPKKVRTITEYAIAHQLSFNGMKSTIKMTLNQFATHSLIVVTFLSFQGILVYYIVFQKRKAIFYYLAILALGAGFIIFFSFLGRLLPARFMHPLLFILSLYSLFIISKAYCIGKRGASRFLVFLCLGYLLVLLVQFVLIAHLNNTKTAHFAKILDELPQNVLIFNWDSSLPMQWINVFDNLHKFDNLDIAGTGWPQRSPYDKALLAKYNITDLYQDMIDNPNVYLVATPTYLRYLRTYIKDHYGKQIQIDSIKDFTKYEVWPRYGYGASLVQIKSKLNVSSAH